MKIIKKLFVYTAAVGMSFGLAFSGGNAMAMQSALRETTAQDFVDNNRTPRKLHRSEFVFFSSENNKQSYNCEIEDNDFVVLRFGEEISLNGEDAYLLYQSVRDIVNKCGCYGRCTSCGLF